MAKTPPETWREGRGSMLLTMCRTVWRRLCRPLAGRSIIHMDRTTCGCGGSRRVGTRKCTSTGLWAKSWEVRLRVGRVHHVTADRILRQVERGAGPAGLDPESGWLLSVWEAQTAGFNDMDKFATYYRDGTSLL